MNIRGMVQGPFASVVLAFTALSLPLNLVWETAQLPLYTVWSTTPVRDLVPAILHCTVADAAIAAISVAVAMLFFGGSERTVVAAATIMLGFAYTIFSEWLNVEIRKTWAYSEWMPIVPGLGIGLSPLLQWLVVPAASFILIGRREAKSHAGN